MITRLGASKTLGEKIETGLRDVVALHGAEMGNVQLRGRDGRLIIVAAQGLKLSFLKTFERVGMDSGTVCGRAARSGEPVFVPDVETDADFKPYLDFARSVPFRSVLSYPLISTSGEFVGMVSAHSAQVFKPTRLELSSTETYSRRLADAVVDSAAAQERAEYAEQCLRELMRTLK